MKGEVRWNRASAAPAPKGRGGAVRARPEASEPIYLASQLASICDVDLKTIHNWCHRVDDVSAGAALESYRTAGGHLRFRQGDVLRFLRRWGYPTPDALLRDRPHVLLVERDRSVRMSIVDEFGMERPGGGRGEGDDGLGLWVCARAYVHVWEDPYEALLGLGERAGAGAPPDAMVLGAGFGDGLPAWVAAARARTDDALKVVVLDADAVPGLPDRVRCGPRGELAAMMADALVAHVPPPRRGRSMAVRRQAIAPREPIYVASQVASLWGVDLKTVHGWVLGGDVEAFRTPGGRLRIRRRALLDLLRRFHMEIPAGLGPQRPVVLAVLSDPALVAEIALALGDGFDVVTRADTVASLAEIGALCAGAGMLDAVVVQFPPEVDGERWIRAVQRHPDTRYGRVVVLGGTPSQQALWQASGATATLDTSRVGLLRTVLERALGVR